VAKVVIRKLNPTRVRKAQPKSVATKRMRTAAGKTLVIRKLDADSATFASDLSSVFRSNVAKARRENKRLLGYTDRARASKN
jgi:hypothetical protein